MIRYVWNSFLDCLGEGGGGRVYRALDRLTGIQVAIKVFHDGPDRTNMVRRELAALRAYSHPNIVKVLDVAAVDGEPALVLELAEKGALSDYLTRPLDVKLALTLARQVASALVLIHARGGVHGDVKPSNIYVDAGGTLKLGDFSLGNARGCTLLWSCVAGGTPGYVAPEVARGYCATWAADIYSLGVTLFEMLTACRPIGLCGRGVSPGTIWLELYRHDIPEGLAELIRAATSANPAFRPSARAFQRSLDEMLTSLREADAWGERPPVLRILRAKVRPLGKGIPGLHGMPFVVRGEYFDIVTHSPWHPNHRLQAYHAAPGVFGPVAEKIGEPFGPSFALREGRTIRVFMGDPPQGGERFSLDLADQSGFDYRVFLGCGHILRHDGADGIFLVDPSSNQMLDFGVYREIPEVGDLLVRVVLRPYLPTPTARPIGLPVVRALPGP